MAQLVEHILGKDEVPGPNPGSSSKRKGHHLRCPFLVRLAATIGLGPAPRALWAKRNTVRIPRPQIDKLACQAKGVGIFTEMPSDTIAHLCEYPGSADRYCLNRKSTALPCFSLFSLLDRKSVV